MPEGDSEVYFRVGYTDNSDQTFSDSIYDADLGGAMESDNTKPPKARYLKVHRGRLFYAHCLEEAQGESLLVFSKVGRGEAVPHVNYQYVDRDDGDVITGLASFGESLAVFKMRKIFIIEGDFSSLYTLDVGVGCIDPDSIIELKDKVLFMSEEGYMCFDGSNLSCISEKINNLVPQQYFTIPKRMQIDATGASHLRSESSAMEYSSVYYPERRQVWILCHDDALTDMILVGHVIESMDTITPTKLYGDIEQPLLSWTYHTYPNHDFTDLGLYTDTAGKTRVRAGDSGGFFYDMDSGLADYTSANAAKDIAYSFITGWSPLSHPPTLTKTVRIINLGYMTGAAVTSTNMYIDVDFESTAADTIAIAGGSVVGTAEHLGDRYAGTYQLFNENFMSSATGNNFRVRITGSDQIAFGINHVCLNYRLEGIRFWTPTRS